MKKIIVSLLVLAAPFVSYATLTQTGVTTSISGNKSITTFQVSVSESASYYLKFWLMGVKHTDNSYSSYNIRIDNNVVTDYVETDRGDWYLYKPKNNPSVYLTAGNHLIRLEGTLNDIPNAELIKASKTVILNDVYFLMQEYQMRKNHSDNSPVVYGQHYAQIEYFPSINNPISPQCNYTAELYKTVYYTFSRMEYYIQGQTVSYVTDVLNNVNHVLNVFSVSNSESYSWTATSTSSGHATMTLTIPQTGFYYVMVRSEDPDEWGICNLTINNDRVFESVPVNCSYTEINEDELNDMPSDTNYACFAKRTQTGDPIIMLMDDDGKVVKYNDDYPFDTDVSSYDWGTNARIDGALSEGQWIFTTSKSYPRSPYFDIYTGCVLGESLRPSFPYLKEKDIMYSADSSTAYNCVSWALGIWTESLWVEKNPSYNQEIDYYEELDSLFAIYGYTSNGATEANAVIDLWKHGNACSHASVRAKGHQYAAGYAWESKIGETERLFHPRYALENPCLYGQVFAHYIKIPNTPGPGSGVILNIPLSQDDFIAIDKGVSAIPQKQKDSFDILYNRCHANGRVKVSICIDTYEEIEPYNELLYLCKNNSMFHYLLYQKVCNREVLAIKLLKDLTMDSSQSNLWFEARQNLIDRCKSEGDKKLMFTIQTQAMLLVKFLLAKNNPKALSSIVDQEATCSNDPMIETSIIGNHLTIMYNLQTDAMVSLMIGTVNGSRIRNLLNSERAIKGRKEVHLALPSSGVYIIGLIVNGCVYKKKVHVK